MKAMNIENEHWRFNSIHGKDMAYKMPIFIAFNKDTCLEWYNSMYLFLLFHQFTYYAEFNLFPKYFYDYYIQYEQLFFWQNWNTRFTWNLDMYK